MNEKITLLTLTLIWSILYFLSSNLLNQNYFRVNKIQIKPINKIPDDIYLNGYDNIYLNNYKNISLKKFEANLDFNKTCQINVLNIKVIENIIYNIELYNYKYYTLLENNNLCEKPETFGIIILKKISINVFIICVSLLFTIIFINFVSEFNQFKINEFNIFNCKKRNYKKNDSNNLEELNIIDNKNVINNIDNNILILDDEFKDYDIIDNNDINDKIWLENV
jgi:hypothetical protein